MDYSSTNITIPASGSALVQKSDRDPDADTSSTKTEVEEMELDQLSDLEDNLRAHENVRILSSIKVHIFRNDHKNLKKIAHLFLMLLTEQTSKRVGDFFSNFVAFSQYLNQAKFPLETNFSE